MHHQSFFSQSQGWQINLAINQMQFSLFNGEWNHNWKIINDLYSLCKEMQCRYGINCGQWRMFNRDFIVIALCTSNWSPAYFRLNSDFHGDVMVRVSFFYINIVTFKKGYCLEIHVWASSFKNTFITILSRCYDSTTKWN